MKFLEQQKNMRLQYSQTPSGSSVWKHWWLLVKMWSSNTFSKGQIIPNRWCSHILPLKWMLFHYRVGLPKGIYIYMYVYIYIYVFAIPCFNDDQNFTEDGWRILLDKPQVPCDSSFFCLISPEIHHENRWCNRVVAFYYHLKGWC